MFLKILIYVAFFLVFLFLFTLLACAMFWVVMKVLRSMFPAKFSGGGRRTKDEV